MTIPYAEVIGDPISHSKSPLIHGFWLERLGLEGEYRATRVMPDEVAHYLAQRRQDPFWRGCNVTMPLKRLVEPHLDFVDPSSERAGSTNCIFWDEPNTLAGCNTDTSAVAVALEDANLRFRAAAIIGSGAAAQTALWCLKNEEVGHVRFVARNRERAASLLRTMNVSGDVYAADEAETAFSGTSAIINASPLGMQGFPTMPRPVIEGLRQSRTDAVMFDMVYDPVSTELLRGAIQIGRVAVDGLTMLIAQARDSFAHFFDGYPDLDEQRDAKLRRLLTS